MAAKSATLEQVMELIREGQASARQRHEDLKTDFEAKHTENRERRHAIMNKIEAVENRQHNLETRTGALETQMVSVIGDNSGGSGLLHKIDEKVDTLQSEFAGMKRVLTFLAFIIPIVVAIALAVIYKH